MDNNIPGNIAVIGGTGFEQLPPDIFAEAVKVETPYGMVPLLSLSNNYVEPYKLYFLSRHGASHGLAPHQINYRANIAALVALDVRYVFATNAVGALRLDLPPGTLVLLDDFIDFTRNRPLTFYADDAAWQHRDFSEPYSAFLRAVVIEAASALDIPLVEKGTYVCADGPRFETPAEVRLFGRWGGDVVGMTGLPEAVFAKEAGLEYAALAMVTNPGAGLTPEKVDHEENTRQMQERLPLVRELLLSACGLVISHTTQPE